MKTTVNEANKCPNCGGALPAGALAGFCPVCLLAQGEETEGGKPKAVPFEPPPLEEVVKLFPQLEILSLLGAGGMGAVYQARQPALDRMVALKILPSEGVPGANFTERFNREARALARLSHPNIVAVHEFGQAGGLYFFIMEFVDGANLRQLEQAGRLSPREALQIIPQICDALQYAHDEGVVHRDIKPENVLMDRKGRVKIADFGLAKILGRDVETLRLTAEGQVMGTPHYMAPEQVERPLSVDHRADIYSLGVVFYEMLTGDLPLGKFQPPSRKVQMDVRLDEVVLRALENDPARRYQRAGEVKTQVESIAGSPATPAAPPDGKPLHWAGFPLVVEKDGVRTVNDKEMFKLFGITFGLISLAFLLVTAVTGRTFFGWLGISGGLSLLLRLLIAALTTAWGVRRALRSSAAADSRPQTPGGTVILTPPPVRRWVPFARVVGIITVCVAGWIWVQDRWLAPYVRSLRENMLAAQSAVPDPQTGAFLVNLPGRGQVELLALANDGAAPNQWWRPDGTPVTGTTYELHNPVTAHDKERRLFHAVIRRTDLPDGADGPFYESEPEGNAGSGREVYVNGKPDWSLGLAGFSWLPSVQRATIRVGFALDPWRTITTHDANGNQRASDKHPGDPRWEVSVHGSTDAKDGAQTTLVMGPERRDWRTRVIAIDHQGKERTQRMVSGSLAGGAMIWTYTFTGLALKDVKEFHVQVRPVHWVAFPDVCLEPTSPLPTAQPLRFGEVMERTFDELIDFDTGRTSDFPAAKPGENPLGSIGENILWAQENGFDAAAGVGELQILDATFTAVPDNEWDTLTPQGVVDRYYQGTFKPRVLQAPTGSSGFRTYVYKTREDGFGLLQLVRLEEGRTRVTVRIKRVENLGRNRSSASAGSATQPAVSPVVSAAFGPVLEHTVPEPDKTRPVWFDLDKGVTVNLADHDTDGIVAEVLPASTTKAESDAYQTRFKALKVRSGVDLSARLDGIPPGFGRMPAILHKDMVVVAADAASWETMTPEGLQDALHGRPLSGQPVMEFSHERPITYLFRTFEGGTGILQLTGFTNQPPGIRIRYRLLGPGPVGLRAEKP